MAYSAMSNLAAGDLVTEAEWDKIKGNTDDLDSRTTAASATVDTSQTTTSLSYTDLATSGPAVTVTTGTTALVSVSFRCTAAASNGALGSVAVSGATTSAAADNRAVGIVGAGTGGADGIYSRTYLFTGLTAGANTFTLKYRAQTAGTATFQYRHIIVQPGNKLS